MESVKWRQTHRVATSLLDSRRYFTGMRGQRTPISWRSSDQCTTGSELPRIQNAPLFWQAFTLRQWWIRSHPQVEVRVQVQVKSQIFDRVHQNLKIGFFQTSKVSFANHCIPEGATMCLFPTLGKCSANLLSSELYWKEKLSHYSVQWAHMMWLWMQIHLFGSFDT